MYYVFYSVHSSEFLKRFATEEYVECAMHERDSKTRFLGLMDKKQRFWRN